MSLLNENVRQQVKNILSQMPRPVLLRVYARKHDCPTCAEAVALANELGETTDRIHVQVVDPDQDAMPVPAIVLLAQEKDGAWKDDGVHFYGLPSGYEFASLISSLQSVSKGEPDLSPAVREALASLAAEVELRVFVTPTCPYCPRAVVLAHQMALASPRVRAAMVEAMEFPEEADRHGVSGVPHTVINGSAHVVGAVPEEVLLDKILRVVGQPAAM
ncbi:MAG: thioredoxin family protein [Chloroflexota bacterium]